MKVLLKSRHGISIKLQPARFRVSRIALSGDHGEPESVPTVRVGTSLIEEAVRLGGISTASGLLTKSGSSIGVVYAYGAGYLAAMLFDLGEPEVGAWLNVAITNGHLPLALTADDKQKLFRLPIYEAIEDLATRATSSKRASLDDLAWAMQSIIELFDDRDALESQGIDVSTLTQGSVSLLTPTEFVEASAPALH
jgi:hypothetical protein